MPVQGVSAVNIALKTVEIHSGWGDSTASLQRPNIIPEPERSKLLPRG